MVVRVMIRKAVFLVLTACLVTGALLVGMPISMAQAVNREEPERAGLVPTSVTAEAALLMEYETGRVLYEKNGEQKRPMASTTKIMTALLALEEGDLDDEVTVSPYAASKPGSTMKLKAGDVFSLEELLWGLLLFSGNDASVAIAEHIAGSEEAFVARMNRRAEEIGAVNTRFRNPHGLSAPGHYSTAYDLALVTRYALRRPLFSLFVSTKRREVTGENRDQLKLELRNTNRLLWKYEPADGVKTGTTVTAGECLVASATRGKMRLIAVVLRSQDRWADAQRLLEYGFDRYQVLNFGQKGQVYRTVPVSRGVKGKVPVVFEEDLYAVTTKDRATGLKAVDDLPAVLEAPLKEGEPVGGRYIYLDGELQAYVRLVSAEDVARRGFLGSVLEVLRYLLW